MELRIRSAAWSATRVAVTSVVLAASLPVAMSVTVTVAIGVCGCSDPPAPAGSSGPSVGAGIVTLSAAELARVPQVLAERRGDQFSRAALVRDNARIFLSLAEAAADEQLATAALRALQTTWTHSERYAAQLQLLTPEYAQVVALRLQDERPTVQAAAMQASTKCLLGESPDHTVVAHLVQLATESPIPAARYEALEALSQSSEIRTHPEQIAPFVHALDAPEAWLVSGSLLRLVGFGAAWPEQQTLRAALRQLLTHADPGVRGRAATTLSSIVGPADAERDDVARALLPLLSDPHPFPRSAAATALAWLDYRPAVHALVLLLDDPTPDTYDLRGYTRLDGTPGWIHHDGSPWSRVDDAALRALQSFSGRVGSRFTFDIQRERLALDLAAAARGARDWYATVQDQLPPPPLTEAR
ncbi:MAG: HEAT repeat domain-containing protein [Myxococcales bacterium]|nr:HEAT repeat domain-containing protein [Myxococcales bacterium]MCB9627416.1 HEAT repeat domain-containing protein [Sandaracinaceae bacterium]